MMPGSSFEIEKVILKVILKKVKPSKSGSHGSVRWIIKRITQMSVKTMETFSADKKESKKRKLPLKKKLMNHRFHPSGVSEKVVSQILDVDWELKIDDPGIFLEMRPPVDIHNAMIVTAAFLPVGLVVGATPNDSTANLLAW